jgi:hypothetical protein
MNASAMNIIHRSSAGVLFSRASYTFCRRELLTVKQFSHSLRGSKNASSGAVSLTKRSAILDNTLLFMNNQRRQLLPVKRFSSSLKDSKNASSGAVSLTKRPAILDNTLPFMNNKRKFLGMSLSELAGHSSFLCVTFAYVNSDILVLRYLVMGGISLAIIFQFYRPAPLWVPIRWNILLLAINTAMITALLIERNKANRMPPEWKVLFEIAHFEKRGFSKVEFCRLFELGKKVRLQAGERLAHDGRENTSL